MPNCSITRDLQAGQTIIDIASWLAERLLEKGKRPEKMEEDLGGY
jgi:hypothetical protein